METVGTSEQSSCNKKKKKMNVCIIEAEVTILSSVENEKKLKWRFRLCTGGAVGSKNT